MKRVILHWSASGYEPSAACLDAYHFIIDGAGEIVPGDWPVSANASIDPPRYAAHTRHCNTGSIGVSVAAMFGATGWPAMDPGPYPILPVQIDALAALVARLCADHRIAITRETVLTHAEVEPALGIAQRGKWDIRWLPGMDRVGGAVEIGDMLRGRIARAAAASLPASSAPPRGCEPARFVAPVGLDQAIPLLEGAIADLAAARDALDAAARPHPAKPQ